LRLAPFAAIVIAAMLKRIDPGVLDAGRLLMKPGRFWRRVLLPLTGPALIVGFGLVAALSLSELGATLIVVPPGSSTLTIRIYNMLHYGASDEVAGLSFLLVLLTLALSAPVLRKPRWEWS
jgi:iron(III) transport system permease protein